MIERLVDRPLRYPRDVQMSSLRFASTYNSLCKKRERTAKDYPRRFAQSEQIDHFHGRGDVWLILSQRELLKFAAVSDSLFTANILNQYPPHGLGGSREKVSAIAPAFEMVLIY
jgi:hypothetical protein